ncbi:MAG: 8-oxo-dGTP pyrophosphatase MutT (NUDIX family) [Nitrospinales bacterium]|jgi:8-oxo-dGTP pyrophosphatase MutT (NUDIX family)
MDIFLITTKLKSEYPLTQRVIQAYPQKAAVLVILYSKNNKTHVLMTKRALHLRSHAGEISFPGGIYEEDKDSDLLATALRETAEEVGANIEASKVIAELPIVKTRLGFEITPFVCVISETLEFDPEEDEVAEVLEIPFTSLLATQQRDVGFSPEQDMVMYWFKHHRIWGASAKILLKIQHLSVY